MQIAFVKGQALRFGRKSALPEAVYAYTGDATSTGVVYAPMQHIPPRCGTTAGSEGTRFVPFEGDGTLAIILSKALLLAEDTKITDSTITRQLRM